MSDEMNDVAPRLVRDNDDQNINIIHEQNISQAFLDSTRIAREESLNHKEGDYMRVASVPVAVHEQWLREGFDMMKEPAKAILLRLKTQDLHAFITTKKQV
jgi:predicted HTH transcriptional regulator